MVVCIALGVDVFREGTYPPLYIWGDRFTWKVLVEYSWSPTKTRSRSFLRTAASSTPIRVVIREVRYIHVLSLTLEHYMPVSSPATPGLTCVPAVAPRARHAFPQAHHHAARPPPLCPAAPRSPAPTPLLALCLAAARRVAPPHYFLVARRSPTTTPWPPW